MTRLGERELTRRTWAAGAWGATTPGEFDRGAPTTTTIRGVFRPMPARQVQFLEEGDRIRDPKRLAVTDRLVVTEQGSNLVSDQISPDGGVTWWEITAEHDGSDDTAFLADPAVNHWGYDLLKVQEPDG